MGREGEGRRGFPRRIPASTSARISTEPGDLLRAKRLLRDGSGKWRATICVKPLQLIISAQELLARRLTASPERETS